MLKKMSETMSESQYKRYTQLSVTNFLCCGDEYLFLKRADHKSVDPGRVNGVGGRVESDETIFDAAIRETKEETGYVVEPKDVQYSGILRLMGGYEDDWLVSCFKIVVPHKNVPIGFDTEDGELFWVHKDTLFTGDYDLVDDLHHVFEDIVRGEAFFFLSATLNTDERIVSFQKTLMDHHVLTQA